MLALPPMLAQVLERRYLATPFKADTDFVFAHPETGARLDRIRYAIEFREALAAEPRPPRAIIAGDRWDPACAQLRHFLDRNQISFLC